MSNVKEEAVDEAAKPSESEPKDEPAHQPNAKDEVAAAIGLSSLDGTSKKKTTDGAAQSGRSFPEVLYEIVSDPDTDDICSWLPHGRGFMILNKNRFGSEILPKYFEGTKYTR